MKISIPINQDIPYDLMCKLFEVKPSKSEMWETAIRGNINDKTVKVIVL